MTNRRAIFLCNLKPAKMRGVMSHGMIMCASTPDKVEVISPPSDANIGDAVKVPEFPGEYSTMYHTIAQCTIVLILITVAK